MLSRISRKSCPLEGWDFIGIWSFGFWSLDLGASLELGVWRLELRQHHHSYHQLPNCTAAAAHLNCLGEALGQKRLRHARGVGVGAASSGGSADAGGGPGR